MESTIGANGSERPPTPGGQAAVGTVPPHNLEAEGSVLGALLLDQLAITRVIDFLAPGDFYRENNGQIYRAALALFQAGEPIDNVTLAAQLEKAGVLERVGGRGDLALLQEGVPTAANVEHYAREVKAHSLRRQLATAGQATVALAHDRAIDVDEAIDAAGREVLAVCNDQAGGASSAAVVAELVTQRVEQIRTSGAGVLGVPTGLHELDALTCGWMPGDLIVIGARPSTGKTALGLQAALYAASQGTPVTFFSLEMSSEELMLRAACSEAGLLSERLRQRHASNDEYDRLAAAIARHAGLPLMIDARPMLDVLALVAQARRLKLQEGTGLIIVDYLQYVGGRRPDDRVQEVAAITRQLKRLARDLQLPVIAMAQLNRAVEQRGDKRPVLSDLKESGEIEQTADVVVLIHHGEETGTELIVAKHRNGPTGSAKVRFRREFARFESATQRQAPPAAAGDA